MDGSHGRRDRCKQLISHETLDLMDIESICLRLSLLAQKGQLLAVVDEVHMDKLTMNV